jgi:hypothetical protein
MDHDVVIIGAGAAGLMCGVEAGKRGRNVLLLDHAEKIGEKIRISGGGRCNFTNINAGPKNYLSANPGFCISALSRYRPRDFLAVVEKHHIAFHEKTLGQLFCDRSATEIVDMLLKECAEAGARLESGVTVRAVQKTTSGFALETSIGPVTCRALVIATGGLSIPKLGATSFGYDIARQFGLNIIEPRPALVPLTFGPDKLERFKSLAGVAVDVEIACGKVRFREALLFTHRGLSGPAVLQISSYWTPDQEITVNLAPDVDVFANLKTAKSAQPKQELQTILATLLPRRLAQAIAGEAGVNGRMADIPDKALKKVAAAVNAWRIIPDGTEGYRTAEVTAGGVDTKELSSKTLEAAKIPGLYFIGEVVDVTGHLGGYNFQWAWASGHAAGQAV